MPGTLVDKSICEVCGSKVREGSAFCFNCGESVVVEPPPPPIIKPATGTLNGRISEKTLAFAEREPAPVLMPEGEPLTTPAEVPKPQADVPEAKVDVPNLKTEVPAPRPRRTRPIKKTLAPVEVEWVENSGSSIAYIIGSAIFALIAIGLLVSAIYLR